jgi:hypothetical protein
MSKGRGIGYRSAKNTSGHLDTVDLSTWVKVDDAALEDDRRQQFRKRKKAIEMYLNGASDEQLFKKTGLTRKNTYRIISSRCLKENDDGQLNGWRGALPYFRVGEYMRVTRPGEIVNGSGGAGSFKWFLASPFGRELDRRFKAKVLKSENSLEHSKQPFQSLFRWFIAELRKQGMESRGEWPFNTESLGYETLRQYVKKILQSHPDVLLAKHGGPDAVRKAKASDGTQRPVFQLFGRVECDAHKLDARMVVMIPSPHGGHEPRVIRRIWIIVIIEVATRAILGYHLSLRRECGAEDVLSAIKHALSEWGPKKLIFSEEGYLEGSGFPSSHSADYLGACWNEFSVDGALANICARVERPMQEIVGAKIIKPQDENSFSSRRSKDDRPYIETFFRELASRSMHRFASTTGSSPKDKKGRDPEQVAVDFQFQLEFAEELLDVILANYNAKPHSGLGFRSPLTQMDFLAKSQRNRIRYAEAREVRLMVGLRKLCTVLGGESTGQRACFNFANAKYSAEWLVKRPDLLGKKLWLQIENELDARIAIVSDPNGIILGWVQAGPPWHLSPHTLYMRQSIRNLEKRRMLFLTKNCDAVEELIKFSESSKGKKLPVHPAYLQARQVMRASAEALMDMRKTPTPNGKSPLTKADPIQEKPAEKTAEASHDVKSSVVLPRMPIAKTW